MASPENHGLLFKTQSWVLEHPWLDGAVAVLALFVVRLSYRPVPRDLTACFAGLSALAGILLSSITFVISLTYGSNSSLLKEARRLHGKSFSRNWIGMTSQALIASFLPLVSILMGKTSNLGLALAASSMVLILFESARCIFWIHLVITFEDSQAQNTTDGYNNYDLTTAISNYGERK